MSSARRVAGVVTLRSLGKEEGEGVSAERTAVMGMPKGTKWERKVRKVIALRGPAGASSRMMDVLGRLGREASRRRRRWAAEMKRGYEPVWEERGGGGRLGR